MKEMLTQKVMSNACFPDRLYTEKRRMAYLSRQLMLTLRRTRSFDAQEPGGFRSSESLDENGPL